MRTGLKNFAERNPPGTPIPTRLYDLSADPGETADRAAENPDKLAELIAVMDREHEPSDLFPLPAVDE